MYKLLQIFPQKTLGSFVAFLCVSYLGIGGSATAQANQDQLSGKLVITGASTLAPLITEIGKRFESLYPNVRVDVQTGGSSRGVADARQACAALAQAAAEGAPFDGVLLDWAADEAGPEGAAAGALHGPGDGQHGIVEKPGFLEIVGADHHVAEHGHPSCRS